MPRALRASAMALAITTGMSGAAHIDAMSRPHVTVRTYDRAGLDSVTRARALVEAAAILKHAGIAVTWVGCEVPHDSGPAAVTCGTPLERSELTVRFVRLPAESTTYVALGASLIDPGTRTGTFATVYADRVERVAAGAGIDTGVLLGRALVHELGHLLLGAIEHADTGLMKAVWTREVLVRNHQSDWWFTRNDARTMQNAIRHHAVQQLAERR